jgi:F-type H+-transporting ATPase subunit epsilon
MADANKIDLEIVTPEGRKLAIQADEVTAPSVNGEFGVLPGHLPLLAALRTGIVSYRTGSDSKRCAVGPGFAEAGANKLLILTDHYVEREQIDPVLVRKDLHDVQGELAKVENSANEEDKSQLDDLIKKENWLAAELELYGDPPPATMRPYEEYGPIPPPDESEVPVSDDAGLEKSGSPASGDEKADKAGDPSP